MNEKPLKCLLGCCNVQSWTLAECIVDMVLLTILILLNIVSITTSCQRATITIIADIFIPYINIKLRKALLEHDIDSIRLWRMIHLILFILSTFTMIMGVIIILFGEFQNTKNEKLKDNLPLIVIFSIIFEGFVVLWYYPLYQIYIFEKTRLPQTETSPRHQTV